MRIYTAAVALGISLVVMTSSVRAKPVKEITAELEGWFKRECGPRMWHGGPCNPEYNGPCKQCTDGYYCSGYGICATAEENYEHHGGSGVIIDGSGGEGSGKTGSGLFIDGGGIQYGSGSGAELIIA